MVHKVHTQQTFTGFECTIPQYLTIQWPNQKHPESVHPNNHYYCIPKHKVTAESFQQVRKQQNCYQIRMQFFWGGVASVAQLDACLTGGQEVAGSTPTGSATLFRGDWSSSIFYSHSLPSTNSRRAVVRFWQKNVPNTG